MEMFRSTLMRPVRLSLLIALISSCFLVVYVFKDSTVNVLIVEREEYVSVTQVLPTIYVVTPTYKRATQVPDMIRLSQTLTLIPNIFWIVVEDAIQPTKVIEDLLYRTPIPSIHLIGPTPGNRKLKKFGKGVAPRRKSLEWIRKFAKDGVLYFADDDNAYDLKLFEEIRQTKTVSVFPVGSIAILGLSSPIVVNGTVVGFHDPFHSNRKYVVDMAGFAVNVKLVKDHPEATMNYKLGYLEDSFLRGLGVAIKELEPLANNCTEILVWHTKTTPVVSPKEENLKKVKDYSASNLLELYRNVLG